MLLFKHLVEWPMQGLTRTCPVGFWVVDVDVWVVWRVVEGRGRILRGAQVFLQFLEVH